MENDGPKGSLYRDQAETSQPLRRQIDPSSLRNIAELLAGMGPEGGDGEASRIWAEHREYMDVAWQQIEQRLDGMRGWADRELASATHPESLLFYPFGGPDLISAMQFFPEASSYLLVGLEAPGRIPLPEDFDAEALAADLTRLRRPFETFVESGYFVRTEIDEDLSGGQFDGLLPIILICLARDGHSPVSLDYVSIDPETFKIERLAADSPSTHAVRIRFLPRQQADLVLADDAEASALDEAESSMRTVYYFAQDLSDKGLLTDDPFSQLVDHQPAINVYIKSGEYLGHQESFSNFRKLVLGNVQTLLQDDSGIPVRYLRSDRFDLQLYGTYTEVIAAYSAWFQPDLAAAFARPEDVRPLDFAAGYGSANRDSAMGAMMVAERRAGDG